jgi:hypothetical protein
MKLDDMSMAQFRELVNIQNPTASVAEVNRYALQYYQDYKLMCKAFKALATSDSRERIERGLGLWCAELAELSPDERALVLEAVYMEIGRRPTAQKGNSNGLS